MVFLVKLKLLKNFDQTRFNLSTHFFPKFSKEKTTILQFLKTETSTSILDRNLGKKTYIRQKQEVYWNLHFSQRWFENFVSKMRMFNIERCFQQKNFFLACSSGSLALSNEVSVSSFIIISSQCLVLRISISSGMVHFRKSFLFWSVLTKLVSLFSVKS